jgi:hypothetical protein
MKFPRVLFTSLFATLLLFVVTRLSAVVPNPTFTFKENGVGQVELPPPVGIVIPLPSVLAADPGPGGLPSALTFNLRPDNPLLEGDLVLLDPHGMVSDVIRFNLGAPLGAPFTFSVVFYSSDVGGGLPADTGLPTAFHANTVTVLENQLGPTVYTPIAGQPGFEPGLPVALTYRIFSTPDAGWTVSLFGVALCGLGLLRRKLC